MIKKYNSKSRGLVGTIERAEHHAQHLLPAVNLLAKTLTDMGDKIEWVQAEIAHIVKFNQIPNKYIHFIYHYEVKKIFVYSSDKMRGGKREHFFTIDTYTDAYNFKGFLEVIYDRC